MILLRPRLVMEMIRRIDQLALNPRKLPKNLFLKHLNPSTRRRKSNTEQKRRTFLPTITEAINEKSTKLIAEKSAIAIFIGLGSTANDKASREISTTFSAVRRLPIRMGIEGGKLYFRSQIRTTWAGRNESNARQRGCEGMPPGKTPGHSGGISSSPARQQERSKRRK